MAAALLALTVAAGALPPAMPAVAQETAAPSEPTLPPPTAAPVPLFPPDGASFQTWAEIPAFTWNPAADATEHQVVINGGERTGPWLTRAKWSPGDLGAGTWTWQVVGRTNGGVGPASPTFTFTVASGAAPAADPATAPPAADPAAPPAAPDSSAGPALSLGAAGPIEVGQQLGMSGAGFQPSEAIEVRWLGDQGPVVANQTADESGAFSLTLEVPQTPIGDRPVVALGMESGAQAIGWFTIQPSIVEGPADGERVPVALLGFSPQETATVFRDAEGGEALGSGVTDANGTALVDITVPAGTGPLKVYAAGEASGGLAWTTLGDETAAAPESAEAAPEAAPPAETPVPAAPAPQPTPAAPVSVPPPVVAGGWAPTPTMSPEDQAKRDEANAVRERLGLPPLAPGVVPTTGNESAGAASDGVSVDSATTQGYLDPSGAAPVEESAPEPVSEAQEIAPEEQAAADPAMLQPWQGSAGGEPVAVPSAIYNRIEDPETYNVVPAEKRRDHEQKERKDRERRGEEAADPAGDAAPPPADGATPEPSDAPERERDPGPAAAPGTLLAFAPVADTSVGSAEPDAAQPETQRSVLPLGGPETATTFVTFDVSGLGGAKVASAKLTVTGAIGFWGPVSVGVLPGYWVNENGLTWNTAPDWDSPALDASGDVAGFPELPADGVVTVDVSGSVTSDGAITFVLRGTPDTGQAIGSRESAIPARLEVVAG